MSIYDGIDEEMRPPKLKDQEGTYLLQVESINDGVAKAKNLPFFSMRAVVLESSGDGAFEPGTKVEYTIWQSQYGYHKGEIPALCAAILGLPVYTVNEEKCADLAAPEQPAAGLRVSARVFQDESKKGKQFVNVEFTAVPTVRAVAS